MKTTSFGIANYCVPCHAHCRYCLLDACGQKTGVGFHRGAEFARRVLRELDEKRPDLSAFNYIGYCMDTPDLPEYIRFCREHHSPTASFLQMNGFAFREERELQALMDGIRAAGVQLIDLTFYGTEAYHDRFAGRKGDFRFLLRMLAAANRAGLPVNLSVPLLRENLDQMPELLRQLNGFQAEKKLFFLPHSKGRGRSLLDQRITRQEFDRLPSEVRDAFSGIPHRTEAEWLASGDFPALAHRNLNLVLTPENIDACEQRSALEILASLEALDDHYLAQMPSPEELAARYGRPGNQQLFRFRDLLLRWQQQYLEETGNTLYDMHDETHSFSVHLS